MKGIPNYAGTVWANSERLRFLAVGVINTAFGYVCFAVLFLTLGSRLHYIVIQLIAHFVSVGNAFVWHRHVTFRSSSRWLPEFLRFNISYLGSLAYGLMALPLLVKGVGWNPLIAAAAVMGSAVILSYVLHHRYSFRKSKKDPVETRD